MKYSLFLLPLFFLSACTFPEHSGEVVILEETSAPLPTVASKEKKREELSTLPTKYNTAKILDEQIYTDALADAKDQWDTGIIPGVKMVIVNHHLLAPHFIADTLQTIDPTNIENVIILSPNHFHEGERNILSSSLQWKTPFGFTEKTSLVKNLNIANNDTIVQREHGISGLVGFVHQHFPKAQIIPIIQKDATPETQSIDLANNIATQFSPENTAIILSLDISHDLFPNITEFHDTTTLQALKNADTDIFHRLDIDSVPSLTAAFHIAEQWQMLDFTPLHHSNSAIITDQPFQPDTTSYITGYFHEFDDSDCGIERVQSCLEMKNASQKTTALFLGDLMLDRYIRQTLDREGWEYILDWRMKRFMNGSDMTVINFEGAMTDFDPYPAHDMMLSFTSDPKWAPKLKEYGVTIASLANNHSLNFRKEGLEQTRKYLGESDISTFGEPFNVSNISTVQNIRGMKIGLVGYHELFDGNTFPVTEEIKALKDTTDFIVVYAHWGDEYIQKIHPRPQKKAHAFIDAGADIVIGHHPHVVQPMEEYNGKYIFYSLGNFVFDQADYPSVRERLGLGITFECEEHCMEKKISYELFPLISNTQHQVRLMNAEEQQKFTAWFEGISE